MRKATIENERSVDATKGLIALFLSILFVLALNFNYQILNSKENDALSNLLDSLGIWLNGYGAAGAISVLVMTYGLYKLLVIRESIGRKASQWHIMTALLFGFFNLCGLCLYYTDRLPFFYAKTWLFAMPLLWFSYSMMFLVVACLLEQGFNCIQFYENKEEGKCKLLTGFVRRPWTVSFCLILLSWLPWVVSYYPASMDWDVYRQLASFLNIGSFGHSNHDPFFSSCLIGIWFNVGKAMGNENLGVFIYIVLRDICIAAIYAWAVQSMIKAKLPTVLVFFVMLFYAVTPVWGAYAKHAFKDTFAAALYCLAILTLIQVIRKKKTKELSLKDCLAFAFSSCLACLFRGNVIYALLPSAILIAVAIGKSEGILKRSILVSGCLSFLIFNYAITHFGGIKPADLEEALSLPFQVSARIVRDHSEEIGDEDRAALDGYLDFETMGVRYNPLVSDPVKNRAKKDAPLSAKCDFAKALARLMKKYPVTSIEGLIASTYGYYAFTPKHDITAGNMNANMAIFNWIKVEEFSEWFNGFHYRAEGANVRDWLHKWAQVWDRLPILSLTDTIAAYTWVIILLGLSFIKRCKWIETIPILSVLLIIVSCMASPVNDCFRYYSLAAASCPPLFMLLREPDSESQHTIRNVFQL